MEDCYSSGEEIPSHLEYVCFGFYGIDNVRLVHTVCMVQNEYGGRLLLARKGDTILLHVQAEYGLGTKTLCAHSVFVIAIIYEEEEVRSIPEDVKTGWMTCLVMQVGNGSLDLC